MTNEPNIQATTPLSLDRVKAAYFIGIGGIGMSALARYFTSIGIRVSGYDKTPSDLTRELEREGMAVHYNDEPQAVPRDVELVVYTPAIPADHLELNYYQDNGFRVVKRSDVLQAISAGSFNICVAGTHGKTTISTMIAHILRDSGVGCNAFLGGISVNYQTNFWSSSNTVCVIEADEYDRSFLKLSPDIAVITAMDPDHLDIYGTKEAMEDAFVAFAGKIKGDGLLVHKWGLSRLKGTQLSNKLTYSLNNNQADIFASNIAVRGGGYVFDAHVNNVIFSGVELNIGGMHNVENALAAVAVTHHLKVPEDKIKHALARFKGVRRRFQYVLSPKNHKENVPVEPVLVDDYAHHPEELRALLSSIRTLFPQRSVTVIFQPHLYSRTRDLAEGFADALSIADRVFLLPIYPARELPIEGVSSGLILGKVTRKEKQIVAKDELLRWVSNHFRQQQTRDGEVVVMAGAGDIDVLVNKVKEAIEEAFEK